MFIIFAFVALNVIASILYFILIKFYPKLFQRINARVQDPEMNDKFFLTLISSQFVVMILIYYIYLSLYGFTVQEFSPHFEEVVVIMLTIHFVHLFIYETQVSHTLNCSTNLILS